MDDIDDECCDLLDTSSKLYEPGSGCHFGLKHYTRHGTSSHLSTYDKP